MGDQECTWWLDGWPEWLGGAGNEWVQCCVQHDLGGSTSQLINCVSGTSGGWVMGVVMGVGVTLFMPIYLKLKKK